MKWFNFSCSAVLCLAVLQIAASDGNSSNTKPSLVQSGRRVQPWLASLIGYKRPDNSSVAKTVAQLNQEPVENTHEVRKRDIFGSAEDLYRSTRSVRAKPKHNGRKNVNYRAIEKNKKRVAPNGSKTRRPNNSYNGKSHYASNKNCNHRKSSIVKTPTYIDDDEYEEYDDEYEEYDNEYEEYNDDDLKNDEASDPVNRIIYVTKSVNKHFGGILDCNLCTHVANMIHLFLPNGVKDNPINRIYVDVGCGLIALMIPKETCTTLVWSQQAEFNELISYSKTLGAAQACKIVKLCK